METVRDVAVAVLRDFGIVSMLGSDNDTLLNSPGLDLTMLDAVARYITGGLQEIYNDGPSSISERPFSDVLRPQTAVTLNVTQYSKTVSSFTTWASWMEGCSIRIGGDTRDNRILSATELLRPYMGATATGQSANVWGDCLLLSSSYSHILKPVRIPGLIELGMASDQAEFDHVVTSNLLNTPRTIHAEPVPQLAFNNIGQPAYGFVESFANLSRAYQTTYLRISPMPDQAYPIEFRVRLVPPTYTRADIQADLTTTTDPLTALPMKWVESVLYPFARMRASSDPAFSDAVDKGEVARQWEVARAIIDNSKPAVSQRGCYTLRSA